MEQPKLGLTSRHEREANGGAKETGARESGSTVVPVGLRSPTGLP